MIPEVRKIGKRRPLQGLFPQQMADSATQGPRNRNDPDRLAAEDGFRQHRDAVCRHVNLIALFQQGAERRGRIDYRFVGAVDDAIEQ